jgi:hypothetical protein
MDTNVSGIPKPDRRHTRCIALIAMSFVVSIFYSYLLSSTERGLPFFDWFNIALYFLWLGVLSWVAWDVYRGNVKAKGTLLFLTCLLSLLTGFELFDESSSPLLATVSTCETLLLFGAYLCFPISPSSREQR